MNFEQLKEKYNDHDFKNFQEIVKQCNAVGIEQCLCYGHEFPKTDCTIEKCHVASLEKPCSPGLCFELENTNPCVWCRRMESYCIHRREDGECSNDEL